MKTNPVNAESRENGKMISVKKIIAPTGQLTQVHGSFMKNKATTPELHRIGATFPKHCAWLHTFCCAGTLSCSQQEFVNKRG